MSYNCFVYEQVVVYVMFIIVLLGVVSVLITLTDVWAVTEVRIDFFCSRARANSKETLTELSF